MIPATSAAYDEALALARALDDRPAVARNLYNSVFPMGAGTGSAVEPALARADEAIAAFEDLGDALGAARVQWIKASILMQQERDEEAHALLVVSVRIFREADSKFDLAWALHSLGLADLRLGRLDEARPVLVEGLALILELGDIAGQTIFLGDFSDLAARAGDAARAIRLRGASTALQKLTGSTLEETMTNSYLSRQDIASGVDEAEYKALFEAGYAMSREEAVAYALEGGQG